MVQKLENQLTIQVVWKSCNQHFTQWGNSILLGKVITFECPSTVIKTLFRDDGSSEATPASNTHSDSCPHGLINHHPWSLHCSVVTKIGLCRPKSTCLHLMDKGEGPIQPSQGHLTTKMPPESIAIFCGICVNPDPAFWPGAVLQDNLCLHQPNQPFFTADPPG